MVAKTKKQQFTRAAAKRIGDKLGINWDTVDLKEFLLGMNTECAAGVYNPITKFPSDDPILIGKIVRAHLLEASDYYTRWVQHEKDGGLACL